MQNPVLSPELCKSGNFPFKLDDLVSWTIKRTDGTITKFVMSKASIVAQGTVVNSGTSVTNQQTYSQYPKGNVSLGSYCSHVPSNIPVADFPDRENGRLGLWVGGMSGARQTKDTFDFVVDGGDVISLWGANGSVLTGDDVLAAQLGPFVSKLRPTRVLKIDWDDRKAPPVHPEFWVELNKQLHGDVMTCCVGGHGRSGTAFVCLVLVNAPDYDAMDAIVHLRAVHCPRAIESVEQWEYIDKVAEFLGRKANAKEAMPITDYAGVFKVSEKPTAVATRKMLLEAIEQKATT